MSRHFLMPVPFRRTVVLLLLPALVGTGLPAFAAESTPDGPLPEEMMTTDPADLPLRRVPDVRLLLDLTALGPEMREILPAALSLMFKALPDGARAGVWVWATQAQELVEYGPVDVSWKSTAELSIRSLARSTGGSMGSDLTGTGLTAALHTASWDADGTSSRQRHIVIVSGDRTHDEAKPGSGALQPSIADRLAMEFIAGKIRVHIIRMPAAAEDAGLRVLADRTGGFYLAADSVEALGSAFERLSGFTSQPSSIPVESGSFLVESGLREVTLKVDGDDPALLLVDPHGNTYPRAKPGARIRWHDARGFDLITIKRPVAGRWKLSDSGQGKSLRVFAWGDLVLRVEDIPATLFPGNLNAIDFMLFEGDEPVDDAHFASVASASARLVGDGEDLPLHVSRTSGGFYRVEMINEVDLGDYLLEVRVDGPTFSRKTVVPFRLDHPVKVNVAQRAKDVVAWVQLLDTAIDFETLKVSAQYRIPPNPRTLVPAKAMPGGVWQLTVPKAIDAVEVSWSVTGHYRNQKKFELHTETLRVEVPMTTERVFGFDAAGRVVEDRDPGPLLSKKETAPAPDEGENATAHASSAGPVEPELPLWMVIAVALINLGLAVGGVLLVLRKRPDPEPQISSDSPVAEPAPEPAAA